MAEYDSALVRLAACREDLASKRDAIEEEVRLYRVKLMASSNREIRQLVLQAYAQGANIAKIKKAYGTRDHRTIAGIIESGTDEINAIVASMNASAGATPTWFTFDGDEFVDIEWQGDTARFTISMMEDDGEILLTTSEPRFNAEDDSENDAVRYFDGYTSDEVPEIAEIKKAMTNG